MSALRHALACVAVGCWLAFGPGTSAVGAPFLRMTVPTVTRRGTPPRLLRCRGAGRTGGGDEKKELTA